MLDIAIDENVSGQKLVVKPHEIKAGLGSNEDVDYNPEISCEGWALEKMEEGDFSLFLWFYFGDSAEFEDHFFLVEIGDPLQNCLCLCMFSRFIGDSGAVIDKVHEKSTDDNKDHPNHEERAPISEKLEVGRWDEH